MRLNSAGASLRPLRSPVAPKITIAVGSGLRRFVDTVPRISPTTEELGGLRLGCSAINFLEESRTMCGAEERCTRFESDAHRQCTRPRSEAALRVEPREQGTGLQRRQDL